MDTADTIIAYYQETLISQYFNKPKAVGTIGALLGGTGDLGLIANAIYTQVRDGFDLQTAIGKQLDILGKFRGAPRQFESLNLAKNFMQIGNYTTPAVSFGVASYETSPQPPGWYFMTYEDFISNTLPDGDYRRVLQFLAAVHNCDYAYSTLDQICYSFFGANVNLKKNGEMAILYQHLTSDTDNLFTIINQMGRLPAPAGFSVSTAEVGSF